MKIIKALKFLAFALIFTGTLIFTGCQGDSSDDLAKWDVINAFLNPVLLTKEQEEVVKGSNSVITVNRDTKTLYLSGVDGKTIYMARSNPSSKVIEKENTRCSIMMNADDLYVYRSINEEFQPFQNAQKKDPHEVIYENFLNALKSYTPKEIPETDSRRLRNYSVGETESFYAEMFKNDGTSDIKSNVEFRLIVSEDKYNIWVKTDDKYYNQYDSSSSSSENRAKFVADAEKLGKKFINGYGLVSHIYGDVSDCIYTVSNDNFVKYGEMTSVSRTGDKINILLYDMLDKGGVYGFVTPRDFIKGFNGSNEGRFIYMDSQTIVKNPMEAYTTALHEFSHNISFTQKTLKGGRFWTYWYGELLAMICEDMMQTYLGISDSNVDSYLENTPKVRIAPANYTALWGQGLSGENVMTYSASYMVGAWLTRKFGGIKFVRTLARNYYVDMDSILRAVKTVTGKTYTAETLIQEMAGDLLVESEGSGLNQDTRTFNNDIDYIYYYMDENSMLQAYNYKFTAINLWEPFYGWCDIYGYGDLIGNSSIEYSALPAGNIYAQVTWAEGQEPETAYLGPLLIKDGTVGGSIGPYGSMLYTLGEAETDDIDIGIFGDSSTVKDVLTIWVK